MQKTLSLCLLALTILAAPAVKATNLGGIISANTTLTKANSPYYITSNLLIDVGATLTIEAGVEIKTDPNILFYIDGGLRALGTETDPVKFNTSAPNITVPTYWKGFSIRNSGSTDSIIMNHCMVENSHRAFDIENRVFVMTNSTINHCYNGIFFTTGSFTLKNSLITNCYDGITADKDCDALITDNEMFNITSNAIYTVNNVYGNISNNNIHDNGSGIIVGPTSGNNYIVVSDNKVWKNKGTGVSISAVHKNTIIKNNIIAYNKVGLSFSGADGVLSQNTIKHNYDAVIIGWINPTFEFYNNCIDSTQNFIVINNTSKDLFVGNNYWGTGDSTVMHAKTYDYFNNFTSGKIYYYPYLLQPDVSCQQFADTTITTGIHIEQVDNINIYPNPFNNSLKINAGSNIINNVSIYNLMGVCVKTMSMPSKTGEITIDMTTEPAGIYIYKITGVNGKMYSGKVFKQ